MSELPATREYGAHKERNFLSHGAFGIKYVRESAADAMRDELLARVAVLEAENASLRSHQACTKRAEQAEAELAEERGYLDACYGDIAYYADESDRWKYTAADKEDECEDLASRLNELEAELAISELHRTDNMNNCTRWRERADTAEAALALSREQTEYANDAMMAMCKRAEKAEDDLAELEQCPDQNEYPYSNLRARAKDPESSAVGEDCPECGKWMYGAECLSRGHKHPEGAEENPT